MTPKPALSAKSALVLAACLLAGWTTLIASDPAVAQVYKWTDADGNVHFSDTPPPEPGAEAVDVSASEISAERIAEGQARASQLNQTQSARRDALDEAQAVRAEEQAKRGQQEGKRQALCARARRQMQVLNSARPVYHTDADGNRVYIDDDTRAAQQQALRAAVTQHCD